MRLRNIPGADEAILNSEYCIKEPESKKGNWQSVFSSTQPLHIEIGMGKGRFIMDMAAAHRTSITSVSNAIRVYFYVRFRKWKKLLCQT